MPIYITLASSQKILDKELARMKLNASFGVSDGANATTNFLLNKDGDECAIVCLFDHGFDIKQLYAMLAHEAVHIFQHVCNSMGEDNPSAEFEAWSIQKISQDLFYEFDRQTKKGAKCKSKLMK